MLYSEWLLVAARVFYKQCFCQRALELLEDGLQLCLDGQDAAQAVDLGCHLKVYACRMHGRLAEIYGEQKFHLKAKGHILEAKKI